MTHEKMNGKKVDRYASAEAVQKMPNSLMASDVVGGLNSSHIPLNTNYAYDPKFNNWTAKSPMPTARHHLQTAVLEGKPFALGGRI